MRLIKIILISFSFATFPTILFSQSNSATYDCYTDSITSDDPVFHKIELNANFQGGYYPFRNFLIKHINHNVLIANLSKSDDSYSDTAKVRFIISKKSKMSNLQIRGTQNDKFKNEIEKALKESSCFWVPGNNGGRKVDGWYQMDFFYFVELVKGELKIKLDFKSYPYAENN